MTMQIWTLGGRGVEVASWVLLGYCLLGKLWSMQQKIDYSFASSEQDFWNEVIHYYKEFELQKLMVLKGQGGIG